MTFLEGRNDYNSLLHLTTKHIFENFWGSIARYPLVVDLGRVLSCHQV